MQLLIRPAEVDDVDQCQGLMNASKTAKFLGGFTYKMALEEKLERMNRTGVVDMYVSVDKESGRIAGTSEITDKKTYLKMGLVCADEELRDIDYPITDRVKRRGIGSSMYVPHVVRAILTCRPVLYDFIHFENDVMRKNLEKMNFKLASYRRENSRNLAALEAFEYSLYDKGVQDWVDKLRDSESRGFEFRIPLLKHYYEMGDKALSMLSDSGRDPDPLALNRETIWQELGKVDEYVTS